MGRLNQLRLWTGVLSVLLVVALRSVSFAADPTVNELKARVSATSVRDRPHLCVHIAEMQMAEADKLFAADELNQAQSALTDVVAYSELARDYAIQSHKYQKQTEIAVRGITRRLGDLVHSLPHGYQAPLREALNKLEHVRDDLLTAMFPQAGK